MTHAASDTYYPKEKTSDGAESLVWVLGIIFPTSNSLREGRGGEKGREAGHVLFFPMERDECNLKKVKFKKSCWGTIKD